MEYLAFADQLRLPHWLIIAGVAWVLFGPSASLSVAQLMVRSRSYGDERKEGLVRALARVAKTNPQLFMWLLKQIIDRWARGAAPWPRQCVIPDRSSCG
jgi:hypothetical protein